jgi:hypothetical protein
LNPPLPTQVSPNTLQQSIGRQTPGLSRIDLEFPYLGITKRVHIDWPDVGVDSLRTSVALEYPFAAVIVPNNSILAHDHANSGAYPDPVQGAGNAIKHSYWGALCARDVGAAKATAFLTAYEWDNRYLEGGLAHDSTMD